MPRAYKLPESLRARLAKPLGRFFTAEEVRSQGFERLVKESRMVVTVGDRVTETVGMIGRVPEVQVVDGVERRQVREPPKLPYSRLLRAKNPAGGLTQETMDAVKEALAGDKPARVLIEGEEDLVAIPVIVFAPEQSIVVYGQPGEGVVVVTVDGEAKKRSRALLEEMGVGKDT